MSRARFFAVTVILVLASLACQGLAGGGDNSPSAPSSNPEPAQVGGAKSEYMFPVTKDAYNISEFGEDSLLYYTKMTQDEVMQFYRDEYTAKGYKEREILTVVSDTTFSMVFDGDPSGKSVVIQSVDLGDGSSTVSIRLEIA